MNSEENFSAAAAGLSSSCLKSGDSKPKHIEHLDLAELSTLYQAQLQVIGEMERKISKLQQIAGELFEIAPACPTRIALWRRYQNLKPRKPYEPMEGISGI